MHMLKIYQITTVSTSFSDGLEKVQKTGKQTNQWNYFRIFFQNWSLSKEKDVTVFMKMTSNPTEAHYWI